MLAARSQALLYHCSHYPRPWHKPHCARCRKQEEGARGHEANSVPSCALSHPTLFPFLPSNPNLGSPLLICFVPLNGVPKMELHCFWGKHAWQRLMLEVSMMHGCCDRRKQDSESDKLTLQLAKQPKQVSQFFQLQKFQKSPCTGQELCTEA